MRSLTFYIRCLRRQDVKPGLAKMYRVPADRASVQNVKLSALFYPSSLTVETWWPGMIAASFVGCPHHMAGRSNKNDMTVAAAVCKAASRPTMRFAPMRATTCPACPRSGTARVRALASVGRAHELVRQADRLGRACPAATQPGARPRSPPSAPWPWRPASAASTGREPAWRQSCRGQASMWHCRTWAITQRLRCIRLDSTARAK